jgi:hypothetical protein
LLVALAVALRGISAGLRLALVLTLAGLLGALLIRALVLALGLAARLVTSLRLARLGSLVFAFIGFGFRLGVFAPLLSLKGLFNLLLDFLVFG